MHVSDITEHRADGLIGDLHIFIFNDGSILVVGDSETMAFDTATEARQCFYERGRLAAVRFINYHIRK